MDSSAPHAEESLNDLVSMNDVISTLEFAIGPNWQDEFELPSEEISLMELVRLSAELNERAVRTANSDVILAGHPDTRTARWNDYFGETGAESGYNNNHGESGYNNHGESGYDNHDNGYGESGESGSNSFCGAGYCYCHATAHPCPDYNGGYGAETGGHYGNDNSLVGVRLFSAKKIDAFHAYNSHSAYYQRDCLLSDPFGFSARHCCSGFCVISPFNASNPVPLDSCDESAGDEFINNEFECVAPCDTSECGCDFVEEEINNRYLDTQSVGSDAGCGCGPRMAAAHCMCDDVTAILGTCDCDSLWEDHSNSYCSCGDAVHHFCDCDDWDFIDYVLNCECSNHLGCAADNHCTCAQGLSLCDDGCCETFDQLSEKCGDDEHAAWIGGDKCCSAHLYH